MKPFKKQVKYLRKIISQDEHPVDPGNTSTTPKKMAIFKTFQEFWDIIGPL